jgi:hypothetical protein
MARHYGITCFLIHDSKNNVLNKRVLLTASFHLFSNDNPDVFSNRVFVTFAANLV